MERAGDQLLAGPRGAEHHDGHAHRRAEAAHHGAQPLHRGRAPGHAQVLGALALAQPAQLRVEPRLAHGAGDHEAQHLRLDGLCEEVPRAQLGRLQRERVVGVAGQHHDRRGREPGHQFQPGLRVEPGRHREVQQDDVGPGRGEGGQGRLAVARHRYLVPQAAEQRAAEPLERRLVVHEQHPAARAYVALHGDAGAGGKVSVTQVLQPGRSVSAALPPCACITRAAIARPNPVPPGLRDTNG